MRKIEVMLFIVSILLVSSAYSIELPWPYNVPYGASFHETLYTDLMDNAGENNIIMVNATLYMLDGIYFGNGSGLYDLNITSMNMENVVFEGETNFTGDVNVGGNLTVNGYISASSILSDSLIVNGNFTATKIFTEVISAGNYCDENGENCKTLEEILNISLPGLINVLNVNANAEEYVGLTTFGGKIDAPNFAAKRDDEGEINYYLENSIGLSRIMQNSEGMYIQSGINQIFIEGYGSSNIDEIKLNANITTTSGDLNVVGIIKQGGNIVCDTSGNNCMYLTSVSVDGDSIEGDGGSSNPLSVVWPDGIEDGDDVNDNDSVIGNEYPIAGNGIYITGERTVNINGTWMNYNYLSEEEDPQVGNLTSDRWCKVNTAGDKIVCDRDQPVLEEEDPFVAEDISEEGQWCNFVDGKVTCTMDAPLSSIDWGNISGMPDGFDDGVDNNAYCTISGDTITCPDGGSLIDTDTTYSEDSDYLTLIGTIFGFDESVLNNTIDARSEEVEDVWVNTIGDTMTGSLSISTSNLFFTNDDKGIFWSSTEDAADPHIETHSDGKTLYVSGGTQAGSKVYLEGDTTDVSGDLTVSGGDITSTNTITSSTNADFPHIRLDSRSDGDNWNNQGAYVAIGESASSLGRAAMYMTYRGDGYGFIGSGSLSNAEPGDSYLRFDYNSNNIYTPDNLRVDGEIRQGITDYGSYEIQTGGQIYTNDYLVAIGGVHVGGTSDPGADTLIVDGEIRQGDTDYGSYEIQTGGQIYTDDYLVAMGGVHVGGTSDPGADNLMVDGNIYLSKSQDQIRFTSGTDDWWWMSKPANSLAFAVYSPSNDGGSQNGWRFRVEEDGDAIVSGDLTVSGGDIAGKNSEWIDIGEAQSDSVQISNNLIIGAGKTIDDDTTIGGHSDDWIKLNGYIEMKSNTDSYGIVLRDKDGGNYLGLTQVGGASYLTDSNTHSNYFLKGDGANAVIRGDLTVDGGDLTVSGGVGDATFLLEADTDNIGEGDQPKMIFSQDNAAVVGHIGFTGSTNHLRIANEWGNSDADIDFQTAGSTVMTITGEGNVDMSGKLTVSGNITSDGTICDGNSDCIGDVTSLWEESDSGIYYDAGDVGIGTDDPLNPLDVIGDTGIRIQHSNGQSNIVYTDSEGKLIFGSNDEGTQRVTIDDETGNVQMDGDLTVGNLECTDCIDSGDLANTIGNLNADSDIGQQLEYGTAALTTLRFDSDAWRLYGGGTSGGGEIVKVTQGGNLQMDGDLTVSGGDITVSKEGTTSTIYFPAQTNDPGYIRHIENNNAAELRFVASDDFDTGSTSDIITFGGETGGVFTERVRISGNGNMQMDGDLTVSGGDIAGKNSEWIDIGEAQSDSVQISNNLIIGAGKTIDDDTTIGGHSDDWIKLNGYIEMKSNQDNYGIVLRDKDSDTYLALTQVGGTSYLTDSSTYGNYFLKGNGADATIRGDLTISGGDITGKNSEWIDIGEAQSDSVQISNNLIIGAGKTIDDDTTIGGHSDDWIKLNGYIEMKSNTDSYGIVLRDKDGGNYLGLTQVGGTSYLTDSSTYGNYFLKGNGADATIRGDLTISGGSAYLVRGDSGDANLELKGGSNQYIDFADSASDDYDARIRYYGSTDTLAIESVTLKVGAGWHSNSCGSNHYCEKACPAGKFAISGECVCTGYYQNVWKSGHDTSGGSEGWFCNCGYADGTTSVEVLCASIDT